MNKKLDEFLNFDFGSLSSFLSKISPLEFASIGSIVGIIIASQLTNDEQNSIGNFFELVGQVILTAQAQNSFKNQK